MTEKTAVHTPTKEEYDRLMKAYKQKGREPVLWHFWYGAWWFTRITFQDKYQWVWDNYKGYSNIITVDEAIAKLGLYERGQRVLVSDNKVDWEEKIYLTTIEWAMYPYICVLTISEEEYEKWECFGSLERKFIKPL